MASLLDRLFQAFADSQQLPTSSDEGGNVRFATPAEQKKKVQGLVDIFKEGPNGQQTRLTRPENQPLAYGERMGLEEPERLAQFAQAEPEQKGSFNLLNSLGPITGLGSPYWKWGLDIGLQPNQPVPSPVSGTVNFVGPRGGFGNQVRVMGDDGREYWLSHLNAAQVQSGQRIEAGQPIGLGGNTGKVISPLGLGGYHLDLTAKEGGKFIEPSRIRDLLRSFG